jgi:hypothetical protein
MYDAVMRAWLYRGEAGAAETTLSRALNLTPLKVGLHWKTLYRLVETYVNQDEAALALSVFQRTWALYASGKLEGRPDEERVRFLQGRIRALSRPDLQHSIRQLDDLINAHHERPTKPAALDS